MQLCADGYDVTNLLSADPALRRRGFKLEYFLRPPVQVRSLCCTFILLTLVKGTPPFDLNESEYCKMCMSDEPIGQ